MKWYYKVFFALMIVPIQAVFLEKIKIGGIKPDIALVFIFVQGWVWGKRSGFFWGMILGGLLDLFSMGTLGIALIIKSIIGALAGILGKSFLQLSLQGYVLLFLGISLLHDISGFFFLHGLGTEELFSALIGNALIRAIYNTFFAIGAILFVWNRFNQKGTFEYGGTILSPGRRSGTRR